MTTPPKPPSSQVVQGSPADFVQKMREKATQRAAQLKAQQMPVPPQPKTERDRVLDAAGEILLQGGFPALTMPEVAQRSGVPSSKLIHLCLSREDLAFQVLAREVQELLAATKGKVNPRTPFPELMRSVSEGAFALIDSRPLMLRLLVGEYDDQLPGWEDRLHELRQRLIAIPTEVLTVGVDQGALRDDVPLETVASLMFEIHVAGYLLHHRPGPEAKLRMAQRRAAVIDVLFNGLRPRPEE